uniref:Uncharacterized protein n=1 Tax=Arachis duranensis TaxID=130453 RepID=N1NKE0_ARADU|nr:hypothetical protein ARAX_ADH079023-072J06-001 [Arachis duranensis]
MATDKKEKVVVGNKKQEWTLDLEEDVDPNGAIDGAVTENCIVERVELEHGLGFNNNKYALYILTRTGNESSQLISQLELDSLTAR